MDPISTISADVSKIMAHVARIADRGGPDVFPSPTSVKQTDGTHAEPYLKNFYEKLSSKAITIASATQSLQLRAQHLSETLTAVAEGLKGTDDQAQQQLQALLEILGSPNSTPAGGTSQSSGAGSSDPDINTTALN